MEYKEKLVNNREMKTYNQIGDFEEALNSIFSKKDFNDFQTLLEGFYDNTGNEEVMFSLLHGVEYFMKQEGEYSYIQKLLSNLYILQPHAYEWSERLILRILNNDALYKVLTEYLQKDIIDKRNKDLLVKILTNLIERRPDKFKEKGELLLSILS